MIFVYEKGSNKYIGIATRVFDNGTFREPTLEELYPDRDIRTLGFVTVKDSVKYSLDPLSWQFKLDETGTPIDVIRKFPPAKIILQTDAKDDDGDGIPELVADGKSTVSIIAKIDMGEQNSEGESKEWEIFFRTTGGRLSKRRVITENGLAKITLASVWETITITVTANVEGLEEASIMFELMPEDSSQ